MALSSVSLKASLVAAAAYCPAPKRRGSTTTTTTTTASLTLAVQRIQKPGR